MIQPIRVVPRNGDDSRAADRAYGYLFVGATRTEWLFDRDYLPIAARKWDNKSQQVPFERSHADKGFVKGPTCASCHFFTDGVKVDVPVWLPYDLFVRGEDVRHLFVTASWSFIWPDLLEVAQRNSLDGAFLRVHHGAKDVTTLPLKPVEDWLR